MTDKDIFSVNGVCSAMACCLILFLIAFEQDGSASIEHVVATLVEIWSIHILASTHGDAIVALAASTTIVPRHEEIIVALVFHHEGSLDGVGASMCRGGVRFCCCGARGIASCQGSGFLSLCHVHGGI